jgi:hypothetical protein
MDSTISGFLGEIPPVQECVKRFGAPGDCFILTDRAKEEKEALPGKGRAVV